MAEKRNTHKKYLIVLALILLALLLLILFGKFDEVLGKITGKSIDDNILDEDEEILHLTIYRDFDGRDYITYGDFDGVDLINYVKEDNDTLEEWNALFGDLIEGENERRDNANIDENSSGFIVICGTEDCLTMPTIQYAFGVRFELGFEYDASAEQVNLVYSPVGINVSLESQRISLSELQEPETAPEISYIGYSGVEPIPDASKIINESVVASNTKEQLIELLGSVQLLTPEPPYIDVLLGKKEMNGISLQEFSSKAKNDTLKKVFQINYIPNPVDNLTTSVSIEGVNYSVMYTLKKEGSLNKEQIYVSQNKIGEILQMPQYALPFMKRGRNVPVPAAQCMNGILEAGEECDLVNGNLENSPSCQQTTEGYVLGQLGARDDKGNCNINCKCVYDKFEFASSESREEQQTEFTQCNAKTETNVNGICIPKTYCGDGIVQTINDDGLREECDFNAVNPIVLFGVSDIGQCKKGIATCTSQCTLSRNLIGLTLPSLFERGNDGIDNDCDGLTEEGYLCTYGQNKTCGSNVGQCKQGVQTCNVNTGIFAYVGALGGYTTLDPRYFPQGYYWTWGACENEITSSAEVGDGIDNNCNAITDEGFINRDGSTGVAVVPEICDGRDNNGNGLIDEGLLNSAGSCDEITRTTGGIDNWYSVHKIYRATNEEGPYTLIGIVPNNTYVFTDKANYGKTYYYKVRYHSGLRGESDDSPIASVTTGLPAIPNAPSLLTATASQNSISLNWKDNSNNEDGFSIYRKTATGDFVLIRNVSANSQAYSDNSAVEGDTYTYKIVAYNLGGQSGDSGDASAGIPITGNIRLIAGTRFKDGHVLGADTIGISGYDDFRNADWICQSLEGSYTRALSYESISGGQVVEPSVCGKKYEYRSNGAWGFGGSGIVLTCDNGRSPDILGGSIYTSIECE